MKKGLVLEGGALRSLFTAGVIDVMMERGLEYDGLIGVSAGAAFGCNYKSRQPGRVIRYNTRFAHDRRYCSVYSLLTTGDIFGADFCYHTMPEKLDVFDRTAFEQNPMEYYVVATDVETGGAIYKKVMKGGYDSYEWIRASASMPLVSRIVKVDGYKLLDGGVSDSIPLKYFQSLGYDRNVVVMTQAEDYVKDPNKLMPLLKISLRKYPKMLKALSERHIMYNQQLEYVREQEKKGNILVLRPSHKLAINHICHDTALMQQVYEEGRQEAIKKIDKIKDFLI